MEQPDETPAWSSSSFDVPLKLDIKEHQPEATNVKDSAACADSVFEEK